jgi:hypothetical protein
MQAIATTPIFVCDKNVVNMVKDRKHSTQAMKRFYSIQDTLYFLTSKFLLTCKQKICQTTTNSTSYTVQKRCSKTRNFTQIFPKYNILKNVKKHY